MRTALLTLVLVPHAALAAVAQEQPSAGRGREEPVNQAFDGTCRAIQLKVAGPDSPSVRTRLGYWATPTPVLP